MGADLQRMAVYAKTASEKPPAPPARLQNHFPLLSPLFAPTERDYVHFGALFFVHLTTKQTN